MTRSRIRSTGPLGTVVVLAFLAALVSGPLRPCFSHPGHAHGEGSHALAGQELAGTAHAEHVRHDASNAAGAPAEEGRHGGCECVGLCQLETTPLVSLGIALAQIVPPVPSLATELDVGSAPVTNASHAAPLARGPPPVA